MRMQYKISLIIISIFLVLTLIISSSYALWVFNVSQESTNIVQSDCFEITLTDNNPIGLAASFPLRDSDGVQTTPYTFTIKNICNHPADFQINLETLNTSTIDEQFIKADLNGHITEYNAAESVEPTIEGAKNAVMLYEDTLAVNGEKTYNLRIWVNESVTQEDVENKSYSSKISVKATVRKQYVEGTLISGRSFNHTIKKLAGAVDAKLEDKDTSITSIEWSEVEPQESDNAINIADDGTNTPIYAWFKEGTIYINSVLDKIYMNRWSDYMFYNMQGISSLDLSHFDTSNVTEMQYMFSKMSSITSLDVSHFDTTKVTNMSNMFDGMNSITSLDVSHFDTSKVTTMAYMFSGMSGLTSLDVSHFDTTKVTNMSSMFNGMSGLTSLDVSHFDTTKVTNMSSMFSGMRGLTSLDVGNFDTSNVTNMSSMFNGMNGLTSLDVSHFDTTKVTNMSYMFYWMLNIIELDLNGFDTSNVTDMSRMFGMNYSTKIDISSFDTKKVRNMKNMFSGMQKLTKLDIGNFDTSNVTNMQSLFEGMSGITSLDVSHFDTSNVTDMYGMFRGMSGITSLDLSNFDTSKVTNMSYMFDGMKSITNLDVSHFDTSNVTNMTSMFEDMTQLTTIYIGSDWNTAKITASGYMFYNDTNIVGGSGTTYDSKKIDKEYARVDDPQNGKTGYFTLKTN